ncbi:MAG: T9SS type A sorting domain-containing protein, partial [Bacteroidota bacterium]
QTVTVFPNPASDVLYVSDFSGTVEIFNISMQKIGELNLVNGKTDVSALQAGIYFLRSASAGANIQARFVVAK